ncbi:MgtC/SapB family protein [Spirochaeta dissipatitropha]
MNESAIAALTSEFLFGPDLVFFLVAALRLILALLCGGLIGWERESNSQPAGLRTHMLICMGAALVMILSSAIARQFPVEQGADPARIAAQVISGVGFIGGGAILRMRGGVKGITTAASLWVAAGLGLTVGAGLYLIAVLATLLILFTLRSLSRFENRMVNSVVLRRLEVAALLKYPDVEFQIRELLDKAGLTILEEELDFQMSTEQFELTFQMKMPTKFTASAFCREVSELTGVRRVKLKAPR